MGGGKRTLRESRKRQWGNGEIGRSIHIRVRGTVFAKAWRFPDRRRIGVELEVDDHLRNGRSNHLSHESGSKFRGGGVRDRRERKSSKIVRERGGGAVQGCGRSRRSCRGSVRLRKVLHGGVAGLVSFFHAVHDKLELVQCGEHGAFF